MFKCICLILRSRLTVTISSGNNISLHDICIVFGQMMLPSLLISCFASCQHSVVVSALGSTVVTQSAVSRHHMYPHSTFVSQSLVTITLPLLLATANTLISVKTHETWFTGPAHRRHYCTVFAHQQVLWLFSSGIHGQVILFTFCYVHFTELLRGQWCAADSVLSLQQVHLVVTRPSPLTITSHHAPLVHNSGAVHLTPHIRYLHACNNWGGVSATLHPEPPLQCDTQHQPSPGHSSPHHYNPPDSWRWSGPSAKQAAKRWPVLLPRCWPRDPGWPVTNVGMCSTHRSAWWSQVSEAKFIFVLLLIYFCFIAYIEIFIAYLFLFYWIYVEDMENSHSLPH